MKKSDRSEFIKDVKARFPEISAEINEQDGLLSFEVEVFIKFIQSKIDGCEKDTTKECLDLLNLYFTHGNEALYNSIKSAICEDINFDDSNKAARSWALEFLPTTLKNERNEWIKFMSC